MDEEVTFRKSHSFNHGPYVPFLRKKKNSTSSRPSSTRSDPNDRNSVRKSLNEASPRRRKKSALLGEFEAVKASLTSSRNSSSPRDSGVMMGTSHCLHDDAQLPVEVKASRSYSESFVVRRENCRERDSYDSAYSSGINNFRMSELGSIRVSQEISEHVSSEINENAEKLRSTYLNEIFDTPSFLSPQLPAKKKVSRKISMPLLPNKEYFPLHRQKEISLDGIPSICDNSEWDPVNNWPDWMLPSTESQMPSQETVL